jgi:hypothetical protein
VCKERFKADPMLDMHRDWLDVKDDGILMVTDCEQGLH